MTDHQNVPVPAVDVGQWTPSSPGWYEETFRREWHVDWKTAVRWIQKMAENPLGIGYRSFSIDLSHDDMEQLHAGKVLAISGLDYYVTIEVKHDDQG